MRNLALGMCLLLTAAVARAETPGNCSITSGRSDGKLMLSWDSGECSQGRHCHDGGSGMPWSRWSGITPRDLEREGATIDARMKAEAGELRCVGTVHDGALRGTYSFTQDETFVAQMKTMGFDGLRHDRLQGYAMLDVTIEWVKELKDLHVTEMNSDNLMGLRALGVDGAYILGMNAAGYPELDAPKLTGMKAVGVSPEKVLAVRAMGFSPTKEELIQMSVFKIDAPFVERMKARGFKNLTISQLVQIKVFKLDE
jgi:hypothetical protein